MILHLLRALFVLLTVAVGWSYIKGHAMLIGADAAWGTVAATVVISVAFVCIDILAPRRKLAVFSGAFLGLLVGISIAYALSFLTPLLLDQYEFMAGQSVDPRIRVAVEHYVNVGFGIVSCYFAMSFIFQTKDDFRFIIPYVEFSKQTKGARQILIDTSVLIDGRIKDVARTGILESQLVVPRFVVNELQLIADGTDKLKRNRGRRGLDTLAELKALPNIDLLDYDPTTRQDRKLSVDDHLLALAKELNARVLTHDFNLNKVAALRGVDIINLNDLANALKPIVLPGEKMRVRVVRPGEEAGQGVGYLDDGTMVVVEQGRNHLNQEVDITVTNMRQTSAGKMIFGRVGDAIAGEPERAEPPRRSRPRSDTPPTRPDRTISTDA